MGKLDDFDLDVKVQTNPKGGVKPSITSVSLCTGGCKTGARLCLSILCTTESNCLTGPERCH